MYRYLVTFHQCLQTHLELRMSLLLLDDTPLETPKTSYNCVCRPDVLLVTTKGRLHVKLIKHPFKDKISHISASKSLIGMTILTAVCYICTLQGLVYLLPVSFYIFEPVCWTFWSQSVCLSADLALLSWRETAQV